MEEVFNFKEEYFIDNRKYRFTGLFGKIIYIPVDSLGETLQNDSRFSLENILKERPFVNLGKFGKPISGKLFPCGGWIYHTPSSFNIMGYSSSIFNSPKSIFRVLINKYSKDRSYQFIRAWIPPFTRYGKERTKNTSYPNITTYKVKLLSMLSIDNRQGGFYTEV
jgi:hypothetical protein